MFTVDREPRHLTPPDDQHPSWNYRPPAEHLADVRELRTDDIDLLLDLAAERLRIKV